MADDQFTAEIENLCRIRRERNDIARLLKQVRKALLEACSIQEEHMIRRWVNQEVAQMYDNLERVASLFDSSMGRYLGDAPTITKESGQSTRIFKTLEVKVDESGEAHHIDDADDRPIRGPGRRHAAGSKASVRNVLQRLEHEEKQSQKGGS